jgi:DNA-binding winged helix-turn-helix (wHTH) protein
MGGRDVFHFGEFTLEAAERRLTHRAEVIRLSPKAHDVLVLLLRHAGHLVTKDELLSRVWPDASVEEGILTVHVSALRKALGDDKRSRAYIETVSRSGYRFVAPVSREQDDRDEVPPLPKRPQPRKKAQQGPSTHWPSSRSRTSAPRRIRSISAMVWPTS